MFTSYVTIVAHSLLIVCQYSDVEGNLTMHHPYNTVWAVIALTVLCFTTFIKYSTVTMSQYGDV